MNKAVTLTKRETQMAELLGCSKRTAQNIKASGKIDKAVYQEGRTIIIDAQMAIDLLK